METQIQNAEKKLRQAMLASDVNALDELLSPELIFTSFSGQLLGKQDDIAAHRAGVVKIEELNPSEQHIQLHGDVAVVSVRMQISGSFAGNPANGDFRFTRVWALSPDKTWHVVAAHVCVVVPS